MKNSAIRYGLLGAAAVVCYFALLYFARKEQFLNPWLQWASLVLYVFFMYRAAREDCAAHGTDRDFREIARTPFVVFLLINLGYWLFYYGLHLADKSLIVLELDANIQYLQQQINAGTGDPSRSNELRIQIADLEKYKADPQQALGPVIAQMAQGALGGFALSASIAAILRSEK